MLFYLKFTKHDIEKLHDLMSFFFEKVTLINPDNFDSDILLPDWYNTKPISRMTKLETLLAEFISFEPDTKQKIINAFNSTTDIQKLFQDTTLSISTARDFINIPWKKGKNGKGNDIDLTICDYLSNLFVYLYKNQLGNKESTFCKKIGSDLNNFYHAFVTANSVNFIENMVCPYCGLEKMRDVRKPDHDHLLPKGADLFVFSSINSKNLFPSGTDCNLIKDTSYLLYSDELITRTSAFYPYSPVPHPFELMSFELICTEIPSFGNSYKGQWSVKINPLDPMDSTTSQNIDSWDRVFKIKERYERVISNSNKSYIDKELQFTKIKNIEDLTKKLIDQADRLPLNYFMLSTEIDVVPKKIFYNWAIKEIDYLQELINLNTANISGIKVDISF